MSAPVPHGPDASRPSFTSLPAFADVVLAFDAPLVEPRGLPHDLAALAARVARWNERSVATWKSLDRKLVHQRVAAIGEVIGDAIRLQHDIRTRRIDDWLAGGSAEERDAFERWRQGFFARCDALGTVAVEALVECDLLMPEEGVLKALLYNTHRLGKLLGGNRRFGVLGMYLGMARVMVRERAFFAELAGRQMRLRGWSLSKLAAERAVRRLNAAAGEHLITSRHAEELRAAYRAMKERGVTGAQADALAIEAMRSGHRASGKSWKGLGRLTDLIVHSQVDPRSEAFASIFHAAMHAPVDYTHKPGKEWIVRDYALGRMLMQIDGKITPGESVAGLQQGRGSLAAGHLRAGAARTEFGRRYSKPLGAFLDSMVVADGADHQRLRKPFLPFFTPRAVLEHAAFVEETVTRLLDHAETVARENGGAFDFRKDFAYLFPIRVVCHVLDLPEADVERVQHWAETSVRAMDTDAGVSIETAKRGQVASDEFRDYLQRLLNEARAGTFRGTLIRAIAEEPTLSERERIGNLGVILFAGFETTTGLLAKGLHALLERPQQWTFLKQVLVRGPAVAVDGVPVPDRDLRWLVWSEGQAERNVDADRQARLRVLVERSAELRARLDATRVQEASLDAAIEEMLRWTAPGTVVPLTASKDVQVALPCAMGIQGRPYAAGEMLEVKRGETIGVAVDEMNRRCPFGAGRFDADAKGGFDVTRTDNQAHLSFGLKHACIGAFLAKENAKRALEGVLRRFPDLVLDGHPVPQDMELFSGLASLPVRTRPR